MTITSQISAGERPHSTGLSTENTKHTTQVEKKQINVINLKQLYNNVSATQL